MRIESLSMSEAKTKLARLETLIPETANEMVYDFGRFVSPLLNPQLLPLGFVRLCNRAIDDLRSGRSGLSGTPITGRLVGLSPGAYEQLRLEVANIADAIFLKEFAGAVRLLVNDRNKEALR